MSDQAQLPLDDQPAQSGGALQDYALDLLVRLHDALSHGFDKDTRAVRLEDLCGAIQLIQSGVPNLRDAERLDQLGRLGAEWRVIVRGQIVGQGTVRTAIDQALAKLLPPNS